MDPDSGMFTVDGDSQKHGHWTGDGGGKNRATVWPHRRFALLPRDRNLRPCARAMSTSPAPRSPKPDEDALIREFRVRSRLTVRLPPRDTQPPARKRRIDPRWLIIVMMLVGLIQGSYFLWAGWSALAAAPIFRGDESCRLSKLDSLRSSSGHACRLESAVVVLAYYSSGRSGRIYRLKTVSADGSRDYTSLAGAESIALWRRLHPTQRVVLQRFVRPGYYLTGKVTAIADSVGAGMTRYHPDSRTHYEGMYATVGLLMFACALGLLVL